MKYVNTARGAQWPDEIDLEPGDYVVVYTSDKALVVYVRSDGNAAWPTPEGYKRATDLFPSMNYPGLSGVRYDKIGD